MVVLDADSVMSGECLVSLVRLMEAHPDAGIIQTAPTATGNSSLHARMQQFGAAVYGPLFTAGMQFWQLGESHYWGHNAILRVAPFMAHCGLAPLPGDRRDVGRDHVARLRRGGADAPCRLEGVGGARPAGKLRTGAAEPADRGAARRPLVPRQPAELAPDVRARAARRASQRVPDRTPGLPVGAAVARVPRAVVAAHRAPGARVAAVLRLAVPALSAVADGRPQADADAVRHDGGAARRAEADLAGRDRRRAGARASSAARRGCSPARCSSSSTTCCSRRCA